MESSLEYKRKTSVPYWAKNFFMFMMFMWVASVTPLTSFNFGNNRILAPIYLLMLLFYYVAYCKWNYKPLIFIVSLFGVWFFCSCLKSGYVTRFDFQPIYSIVIAHIAFNIYSRDEFIDLYEKFLLGFCIISLFVWGCANLLGEPFVNFMRMISVVGYQPPTETHTFIMGLGSQFEFGVIRRNIGFTWEPGRFACWILLGMVFNLVRMRFVIFPIWKNKSFFVLLITLLTTFSTTGYAAFVLVVFFVLLNKKSVSLKFMIAFIVLAIVPVVWNLPFMAEKFNDVMDLNKEFRAIEYFGNRGVNVVCPQRWGGIYMSFQNWIHDFWFGFNQLENSYSTVVLFKRFVIIAPSEGIFGIFAKYGFFVGVFFYYNLIKSSKLLARIYNYKGRYFFMLFFLTISFSYDFWENCILMFFYLSSFYKKADARYFEEGKR